MVMEKALSLTPPQITQTDSRDWDRYDLLYLGNAFCQNLLPSFEQFEWLRRRSGKQISLATSLVTNDGLQAAASLIDKIAGVQEGTEIVVNDIGMLSWLNLHFSGRIKIVLGRVLNRDFAFLPLDFLRDFLKRHNICGVETDVPLLAEHWGRHLRVKLSFHYPLRWAAMTRVCPHTGTISSGCGHPCRGRSLTLCSPHCSAPLLLRGNAYFTLNDLPHEEYIARAVYTPEEARPDDSATNPSCDKVNAPA